MGHKPCRTEPAVSHGKGLNLPVRFFFDGMPETEVTVDEQFARLSEFVSTREGVELNRAFARIQSPRSRRDVIQLVRSLAGSNEA